MIGLRGASIDIHLMRDEAQLRFENLFLDYTEAAAEAVKAQTLVLEQSQSDTDITPILPDELLPKSSFA